MRIYDYCADCGAPMVPVQLGDKPAGFVTANLEVYVQCSNVHCGGRAGHRPVDNYVIATADGRINTNYSLL